MILLSLDALTDISVAKKEGKAIRAHLDTAANSDLIWQQAVCSVITTAPLSG